MNQDCFIDRHIGSGKEDEQKMLSEIGVASLEELITPTIPPGILLNKPLRLPEGITEYQYLKKIREISKKNK